MTRLGLDHTGLRTEGAPPQAFGMVVFIVGFWVLLNSLVFVGMHYKVVKGLNISFADMLSLVLINVGMICYVIYATANVRAELRKKYMIPASRCYDAEDLLYSGFCTPCTISQMTRHTTSYDEYQASCCSKNGLVTDKDGEPVTKVHQGSYKIW